ncbi:FAD-dependent oxidoreductase [Lasiosphaeria hispida]|uniref:D-arabinono-1,4-lactone oxidase n=1 Tax=Lasiosphaeria hispida TaxID=260671 RepID=A0AAJ0HSV6_9PEZI|nr:FAD-dependent oxidoreductase [Lasiosphaeria hispida]
MDPNEAIELFIWAIEKPDDEDKKRQLVIAFEKDPETVLNAVHAVAQERGLYPPHYDYQVPEDAIPTWKNCIDEQPCVPLEYRYPKSLKELVGIIGEAEHKKASVRAIGSGHSFSDITNTQDAVLVDPHEGLKQVFSVDASILHDGSDPANMIRAQCGITVADLNKELDARKLGLINMGAYDGQTISGALSTGTHGSGAKYGPMADFLLSIVLVTESGKVYQIEPSPSSTPQPITDPAKFPGHLPEAPDIPAELKQDDDWFRTAKVAMGCLGIIYSYTIRVQKAFSLSEVRTMTTWEDMKPLLSSSLWPPPILQNTDHFELLINPYAQGDSTHKCIQVKRTREELTNPRGARLTGIWRWLEELGVKNSAALVVLLNTVPGWFNRGAINGALGFLKDSDPPYVDVSHTVFTLGIENTMKAWAVELHIDAADDCVGAIDKVLAAFETLGWYIAGPLGIRFVKSSDAFLAPQAGRFTCTVELDMLYGIHHDHDLLGKVKEIICRTVGGVGNHSVRVHWGLDWGFTTPDDVRKWYPGLGKWQGVYRELNKTGMFDNAFTKRLRLRE